MSKMVVVAVRHKDLDVIETLSLSSILKAVDLPDTRPKRFDLRENHYRTSETNDLLAKDNLLVSSVYDEAIFYITNESMTLAGFLSGAKIGQEEVSGLDAHIAALRFNARVHKLSVVKNRKHDARSALTGDKYSVFGITADDFICLERNPHVMTDIAHYCRYKEIRLRTFNIKGGGIKPLGTFKANQALVVQMAKNTFHVETWPSHKLNFTQDELRSLWPINEMDRATLPNLDALMIREIAEGAGYSTIMKIKAGRTA
jgi:hypothetical protein